MGAMSNDSKATWKKRGGLRIISTVRGPAKAIPIAPELGPHADDPHYSANMNIFGAVDFAENQGFESIGVGRNDCGAINTVVLRIQESRSRVRMDQRIATSRCERL